MARLESIHPMSCCVHRTVKVVTTDELANRSSCYLLEDRLLRHAECKLEVVVEAETVGSCTPQVHAINVCWPWHRSEIGIHDRVLHGQGGDNYV